MYHITIGRQQWPLLGDGRQQRAHHQSSSELYIDHNSQRNCIKRNIIIHRHRRIGVKEANHVNRNHQAAIGGQTYTLTLSDDGYYTLSGTAPALSSANLPGGYYGVQIIATDDAGNETTVNQDDSTWGAQLRLQSYESVKPTVTITYPSNDSRINTCTPTITAQLRDNDSGVDPATLDLRINGGSKITQARRGLL